MNAARVISTITLAGLALAAWAGGAAPRAAACRPRTADPGYRMLFDGTAASLSRWAQAGPGRFELQGDCTLRTSGGLGLLWFDDRPLASPLTLKVEWLVPGDDNSGVFVGFPAPGNDPFVAVNRGYEIQIDATDKPDATTGAVYGFQAADTAVRDRVLNPPGKWNTFEITVDAPRIVVRLNGTVINRFVSTDPGRQDLGRGFVGLQNHSDADPVLFRGVQVKEWSGREPRCPRPGRRGPGDTFAGTRLDGCRWNRVVRYDGGGLEVAGGALHLEPTRDDPPGNLVLQRAPARDWTIETTVHVPTGREAGLLAYRSDADFVKLAAGAGTVRLSGLICGKPVRPSVRRGGGVLRLRLSRSGARYTGYVADGARWARVGAVVDRRLAAGAAFGVSASGPGAPYVAFDRFTAAAGRSRPAATPAC